MSAYAPWSENGETRGKGNRKGKGKAWRSKRPREDEDSWRNTAPQPQVMRPDNSWTPSLNNSAYPDAQAEVTLTNSSGYSMRPIPHKGTEQALNIGKGNSSNFNGAQYGKGRKNGKPSFNSGDDAAASRNARQATKGGDAARPWSSNNNLKRLQPPANDEGFVSRTTDTTRQFITGARFEDLSINAKLKKSLREVLQYEHMTEVQNATLPVLLQGHDVLARAKTGTGKTLAFLIPTIEKIIGSRRPNHGILALALSPTRELAMQIFEECRALTRFIPDFKPAIVYGGTKMNADHKQFVGRCDLLVATPGRLQDHLTNTNGFAAKFNELQSLILDEADQLLETGFRDAIIAIIQYLPQQRQSLLFSATVSSQIRDVVRVALNPQHKFVDCVGDVDESTVQKAKQSLIIRELNDSLSTLVAFVQQAKAEHPRNFKVIVFFTTARGTQFAAEACNNLGLQVIEIHSRKSQAARTQASDKFRNASTGVLFSSDVSARGMDYPNVTHVLQIGAPSSREQYIHRLGRTARAGTEGCGILLLHPWEEYFLQTVKDLPLERFGAAEQKALSRYEMDMTKIRTAVSKVDVDTRQKCYSAWLGFYNGLCPKKIRWSKPELVEWANYYALECLFLRQIPKLEKKTVGKMGLKGVPGLCT